MGLERKVYGLVMVSLVLMAIATMCCVQATIEEEAAKDESWTDWAKEKIGLKHEDNIQPTHTTTTVQDDAWRASQKPRTQRRRLNAKQRKRLEPRRRKRSYDSAGQVKDDVSHKSKQVKDSLSGDENDESWTGWAKEKIGIKNEDINSPNLGETVSEKAKEAKEAAKRKAGDAKEKLAETVETAKEKASDMTSAAKEKAEKLKEEAERESKSAKEKSKESYETAKSKADETLESAKDKASQSYDSAARKSEEAKDTVSHKSKRVKESLTDDDAEL
ncbi:hypothetical protein AtNW77_Chr3g0174741 [Arabidopsis thaliana]